MYKQSRGVDSFLNPGDWQYCEGHNLPPLVWIGLNYLSNSGLALAPRAPLPLSFPWQILNQITKDKREYKCSRIDFQVVLFLLGTMGKSVFWNFVRIFNLHARSVITLKAIKNSIATSKWPWPDCVGSIMNEAEAILGQRLSRAESRRNWVGWGQEGQ